MTDNISKILEENKKAREKIVETFVNINNVAQEDDVDMFYRSIALSVKQLPPHLIAKAKLQHLQIVNDLQSLAFQQKALPQQQERSSLNLHEDSRYNVDKNQPMHLPQQQDRSSLNMNEDSIWQEFDNDQHDQTDQSRYFNL